MDKKITIYHGSKQIVEVPVFGEGKKNNDFGLGFYCTESNDLAKEWAVSSLRDGFSNRYTLDTEYLNILNLNSPDYTILNWIAVLVEHRIFSIKTPVARRAKQYLIDIPVEDVLEFEKGLFEFMDSKHPDIPAAIRDEKVISEETEKKLVSAIEDFKADFLR